MRILSRSITLALLASCSFSGAAIADTWYASPTGSGTDCTQVAPCSAEYAVATKPATGDLVIFAGGTYNLTSFLQTGAGGVSFEGATSGPPTRLIGPTDAASTLFVHGAGPGTDQHISDLIITNQYQNSDGIGLYLSDASDNGAVIDRVHATATGAGGTGILAEKIGGAGPMIVRNSVGRATGGAAFGILARGPITSPGSLELHNVLGYATAPDSYAISFIGGSMPMFCANLSGVIKNSIARAATPDHDLLVSPSIGVLPCTAHVESTHSVWRAVAGTGTVNSVADLPALDPQFVDAANGDFHPVAGSPLVDAGATDAKAGALDLVRNPRVSGSTIDIGPFEYQSPATPDSTPPSISSLKLSPAAFRPKPAATPSIEAAAKKKRKPAGTSVSFSSSEAASVRFAVQVKVSGRKKGKSCSTRARRGERCTTWKTVKGKFDFGAVAGANSFRFSGFMNHKALKPGSYRLVGAPKDAAGSVGKNVRANFKILQ